MTIDEVLTRGVEQILPDKKDLAELMGKKKITLYHGIDPTWNSLHIGHLISIRKLSQFQKLGHKIIFLIGNFTGMIGDPTDKSSTRVKLDPNQVTANAKDYKRQVENIIDFDGENKAEIRFNNDWLGKFNFADVLELCSNFTVQQMLERDFFQKRMQDKKPIYIHEFLYPLMQGYDSVAMDVDLEVGGNDQFFNMMAGRTLQGIINKKNKFVMAMKLLTDPVGKKMGKTDGNAIFLSDSPVDIYGKAMKFDDKILDLSQELLTDLPGEYLQKTDSLTAKKKLAFEIVKQVYGENQASEAQEDFEKTFQKRDASFDTEIELKENLIATIAPHTALKSLGEAKRLVSQKAIEVNGKIIADINHEIKKGDKIKIGKKIFGTII